MLTVRVRSMRKIQTLEWTIGMVNASDEHMEKAFELAQEALDNDEVPVGCVFTYRGKQIGCGRNRVNCTKDPTTHAEMVALRSMEEENPNIKELSER
ncbi:cytidine and deoxycytidylate deaminase zinc-binding region [Necator americanus]|uniref:Cytidine and deoxycytidylate deaminase zinc-binding region n=1 Tax=Necator americanus TaxID=51031 RepID=W2T4F7_NECAM|nr:cytidine and deoxycytidylate deaminase zinc-binding region [Necator americanus]ETN76753.1 cytidine and deoxycytidylate deaminase zinc-binding region [Necator americanus]